MNKQEIVRQEMYTAMKNKDKTRKDVLSFLLGALKQVEIDTRHELSEEEADQVVLKQIKQVKETLELTPKDRTDIIEECNYNLKVLEEFAPKMMEAADIENVIKDVLAALSIDNPTPKDKGNIMKMLMPKVKGKADGKLVNEVLAKMMQS